MVAHLIEDCDRDRENMLNHVKKEQLHPQRRTGIEHTSQKGHTIKKTYNKQDAPTNKKTQQTKKQADGNDIDDDAKKNTTTQTA